jgi:undecaprenyl-diphosphatase
MKKRGKIILGVVILTIICFYVDKFIINLFSFIKNDYFDSFFIGLTLISSEIFIFFLLTSLFLWQENKRRWIFPLWITLFLSAVISFLIKFIIQRPRPFQEGIIKIMDVFQNMNFEVWNFSFPSFQTMFVFCSLPILSKEFPRLKYIWIVLASLVGISRVYFGLHFMSDVLAGGLIGYLIGLWVINWEEENKVGLRMYRKVCLMGKRKKR